MEFRYIRLDKLNYSSTPVRLHRSETQMEELKQSLEATEGPIDPLIVRDLGSDEYVVISGESRLKALSEMGYELDDKVPCLVGQFDDAQALEYALIENLIRMPLTAYERALAIQRLIDDYNYNKVDVARKIGQSRQYVNNLLQVFALIRQVQEALHEGEIFLGHARALYPLREAPEKQEQALEKIKQEGLSVRQTETLVQQLLGNDEDWIIEPGRVYVAENAWIDVKPVNNQYKVQGTFETREELEQLQEILSSRIK